MSPATDPAEPIVPVEPIKPVEPVCSARGCRRPASWGLLWNNPKVHTPERRKVWTACDEHRGSLESFLRSRGFLRTTVPSAELDTVPGKEPDRA